MLLKLYEENPNPKHVLRIAQSLREGGVIIYPTDSVYAFGCCLGKNKAMERMGAIKGIDVKREDFSLICHDLSSLADYAKVNNDVFKLLKRNLPGPFTFVLDASSKVPKMFNKKKKTIGLRIPDNHIVLDIVARLGQPLVTTSVLDEDDIVEYTTDPELLFEKYGGQVDIVVHGGYGNNVPSTVVDCTGSGPVIVRQGIGELKL